MPLSRPLTARAVLLSLAGLSACASKVEPDPAHVRDDLPSSAEDAGFYDASSAHTDAGDASSQASDARSQLPPELGCGTFSGKLDILFVVDNSGSMLAEQTLLGRELPRMVEALTSGDVDGDGIQDHPKADVHVGVVSSDMGIPQPTTPSWRMNCSAFGDDAILQQTDACSPGAQAAYLSFAPDESDNAALACLVKTGVRGCGIEQQLEAMLKAVTPSTSPARFALETVGHGDGPNAGFLRPDSVLAIIHVTDEDDCSLIPGSLLFAVDMDESEYGSVGPNFRCAAFPETQHPASRYVEHLRALRPDVEVVAVPRAGHLVANDNVTGLCAAIDAFEQRMALVPSLRRARSLTVHGDWTFGSDVTVVGDVELADTGAPERVGDGQVLTGD